ncbi:MAG: hypothetical protein MI862_16875 [Desulfobacterales bacterium]|nr:hypothetical protein [Desulfobacterales bacterium]
MTDSSFPVSPVRLTLAGNGCLDVFIIAAVKIAGKIDAAGHKVNFDLG